MKVYIFSVYDTKAESFSTPFTMQYPAMAERVFSDQVKDETLTIGKNPQDFGLFQIGEVDLEKGKVTGYKMPKEIIQAIGVKST